MDNCNKEIPGVLSITLHHNSGIQLIRPNIGIENEVNLISSGENSYTVSEGKNNPKWSRNVDYSGNYKQNYNDEFTFLVHGVANEVPDIIKELRSNRLGYLAEINTTAGNDYIFETPVFLNEDNTKQINAITWQVSLSYRIPSFQDYLILLDSTLTVDPQQIESSTEIIGIRQLALYINKDVRIRRPDPAIENEVDLIAHATGSYVINEVIEQPKWERTITYSKNYDPIFNDEFSFLLHGIESNAPSIIEEMRNNRLGYICEIITTNGDSFVFPAPVFLNNENTKAIDSHSWRVSLSYRVPSFEDRLNKLNTVLMVYNYILTGDNTILGGGGNTAVIG